ncbi:MAG: tRNA lysidine(34) synthetase TilS [Pseudomonadota bacterium]|nr:tRNA lysidine(34) synthetase TilS [Pseudomonadota bacterium]
MSKKNSNVILKSSFKQFKDIASEYLKFKKEFKNLKTRSFIVAISGGPDSLALAAFTKALSYEKKYKFHYTLIDHRIRKKSSLEAKAVKNLLKKHDMKLDIILNKEKILRNIQSQARLVRYKLLAKHSLKKKTKIVLTAHNLEDQVETFFIRLSRGSGLTGLSAMNKLTKINHRLYLFRPLLNTKKEVLTKISKISFNKYFKDPSNKNKKYLRTKIRSLKKPLMESGINYDQIIKSINNLASSKATLDNYFQRTLSEVVKKEKDLVKINLEKFNLQNYEIKMMIINESIKILKKNYYNPRSKKVKNLLENIGDKEFKKATLAGCLFFVKKRNLCLKKE